MSQAPAPKNDPVSKPRLLWQLFSTMFLVGLFTFGGGVSMLPQMTRLFVDKRRWVEPEDITDYFAVAQSVPGVIAVNTAILIGYRLAGFAGAMASAFGAVLPSFLVLLPVTLFYEMFLENAVVRGLLRGVGAAVVALLCSTVWKLTRPSLRSVFAVGLFVAALAGLLWLRVNPIFLLLGGMALGLGWHFWCWRRRGEGRGV